MNFEKLLLTYLITTRDIKTLIKCSDKLFLKGITRSIFKALRSYHKTYGRIPPIEILSEAIKRQVAEDKVEIYNGMLETLNNYDGEMPHIDEILKNLNEAYLVHELDLNIERLVEAAKEKNISSIKTLLSKLNSTAEGTLDKTPDNILNIDYLPAKIRTIDSCMPSMRENNVTFGGLSIIGGTSGGGKSIFTLQQLLYSYSVDKIPTCLLNMELSETETIARMYCNSTGEDFTTIYGNTDPSIIQKVSNWKQRFFSSEVEFRMKSVRYSLDEIESTIRQQAEEGIVLFGIDYLQITDFDGYGDEWKQLSKLVRLLHQLTQELQIVIISPVQINFSDTALKDGELKISVRGSKELEFSSSLFLFIYQTAEEYKDNFCRVFTIKARNSIKNTYMFGTDFAKMTFVDTGVIL